MSRLHTLASSSTTTTGLLRRWAAIIDLENVAITNEGLATSSRMAELLQAIDPYVDRMPVRVATGVHAFRASMEPLARRGWGVTLVPTEPDAADLALCEAAHSFVRSGVTDLTVIGGDHAYVSLTAFARLHVVSYQSHLSKSLRLAATSVSYLPSAAFDMRTAS